MLSILDLGAQVTWNTATFLAFSSLLPHLFASAMKYSGLLFVSLDQPLNLKIKSRESETWGQIPLHSQYLTGARYVQVQLFWVVGICRKIGSSLYICSIISPS